MFMQLNDTAQRRLRVTRVLDTVSGEVAREAIHHRALAQRKTLIHVMTIHHALAQRKTLVHVMTIHHALAPHKAVKRDYSVPAYQG